MEEVLDGDIGWITWALENVGDFELSVDAEREYQSRLDPRRPHGVWVD